MPPAANEQLSFPLTPEDGGFVIEAAETTPAAETTRAAAAESSFGGRLKTLGRQALAVAGVSLAFWMASAARPDHAEGRLAATTPITFQNPDTADATGLQELPIGADPGPFEIGVATYNWWMEGGPDLFQRMHDLGMNVVRLNMTRENWQYDLPMIQREIVSARANDIEPVVMFQQAAGRPVPGWAPWVADMMARLPQVDRMIDQNEPDSSQFWHGTLRQYADQLHATDTAVHEVRPDVIVSGVGLDAVAANDPEGWLQHFMTYVTKKYGSPHNVMDTLSVHLYGNPQRDEQMILADEGLWDGPINVDEFGRLVENRPAGYDPRGAVPLARQASDISQTLTWLSTNFQVRSVENYHLVNPTDPADLHTGLLTPAGVPMPSWFAYRSVIDNLIQPTVTPSK